MSSVRPRTSASGLPDMAWPNEPSWFRTSSAKAAPLAPIVLARSEPLRVAVLGPLAPHDGAAIFAACAEASAMLPFKFIMIGGSRQPLRGHVKPLATETGSDQEIELAQAIETSNPHVLWFPTPWPDTWSYRLSAAIASGRPIVATRIGAFAERLQGRAWTWLIDPGSPIAAWLAAFGQVRSALATGRPTGRLLVGRGPLDRLLSRSHTSTRASCARRQPVWSSCGDLGASRRWSYRSEAPGGGAPAPTSGSFSR